ncbi:hypothetical protein LPB72_08020 [Hydrogenophaga crassostreae]|uniref:DUF5648 domain-containing protein n=1 Tax=Hydrogenophaga crassostreae TaxID=1763535 RepID=A0A167IAL9_9BURK|nr:hypothetical protein [Hydrogenophaga crassostreae]AOW12382.1 hypothetical protein LPB072_05440 [Hydrogenophaga crassostreae]OAD42432.1 hypothetical protein LPB72_08020 [Hydrogenophaga crassostreae]
MNMKLTTTSLILASAGILTACGGGNSAPTAIKQKSATEAETPSTQDRAEPVSTAADSVHSNDAHVLTADEARKSAEAGAVIVKSVPVGSRDISAQMQTIDLGAMPADELAKRERNNRPSAATPVAKAYQIGIGRAIAATSQAKSFQQLLSWSQLPSGNTAGTARFSSADAFGIRLGLQITSLPDNALVRVLSTGSETALEITGASVNQAIASNVAADGDSSKARTYWLPMTTGSATDLEIELPAGVSADSVSIAVPSLVHMLESAPMAELKAASVKSDCPSLNPDPVCNATLPPAANAVSTYDFIDTNDEGDLAGFVCTGTLLADKAASNQPYFLTANHCITSQTVASTMVNYWFYRSSACGSNTLSPGAVKTLGGATLLWTRTDTTTNTKNPVGTDTSFLKLNAAAPAGAMFAGWSTDRQAISNAVAMTALHHPGGDLLRQSTGTISNMGVWLSNGSLVSTADTTQPMYQVSWSLGLTEGGSSGSGLFRNGTSSNPQVVGQLWGGYAKCTAPSLPDYYGRFDLAYQDGLIGWLNPGYKMVFRFYNINNGSHFFSANVTERDTVRNTVPSLVHEGPAFSVAPAAGSGLSPVHRFLNRSTGVHFYTINEAELAAVMNLPTFNYEGIAWYARKASSPAAGTIEVYRFSRLATGTHLYTTNVAERDNIIANLAGSYNYEGVAYRAWPVN